MIPTNATEKELMARLEQAFQGAFQQPQIMAGKYWEVENDQASTFCVPFDLVGHGGADFEPGLVVDPDEPETDTEDLIKALSEFVPEGEIECATVHEGYMARTSAAGYMDCSDWTGHDTLEDAVDTLINLYGDEPEEVAQPSATGPAL